MSPRRSRSFLLKASALAALIGLGGCGSDAEKSSSTTAATATTAPSTAAPTSTGVASTAAEMTEVESTEMEPTEPATSVPTTDPATTDPATTEVATTMPATTTTVPDALSQLPGVAVLDVTAAGTDPTRPTFTWTAAPTAASYQLLVQSADGVALWAWSGKETSTVLGGVERAADVEGPTLTGPSRVRVYAFDATFMLVALSGWVALPGV